MASEYRLFVTRNVHYRGLLVIFGYTPQMNEDDEYVNNVIYFFDNVHEMIQTDLLSETERLKSIKWYFTCKVRFVKHVINVETDLEEEIKQEAWFHGRCYTSLISTNTEEQIDASLEKIMETISTFMRDGSGWVLDSIIRAELTVAAYKPFTASSYIRTPEKLMNTSAIINVDNTGDEMCFVWSILAALYPQKNNKHRVSKYKPFLCEINMCGIEYPVSLKAITKFETLNSHISVNVFGYEDKEIYPLRITKLQTRTHHINLLLLSNTQDQKHYCLISNISRLLSSLTKHDGQTFYCNFCLHRFTRQELLSEHIPYCTPFGEQKTKMPDDKLMTFTNYTYTMKVPFTIYADFESILVPVDSCAPKPNTSTTTVESIHIPSGFCYLIVDHNHKLFKPPTIYRGENVIDKFLSEVTQDANDLESLMRKNIPINMSHDDNLQFTSAKICHLCTKPLTDNDKVRNHCHLTGTYLGAAHNVCNLNFKIVKHIPVVFHNLQGYDSHHLIQGLGRYKKLDCIAITSERFLSIRLNNLRFIDSLQFMNESLEKLVQNIQTGGGEFNILKQCFSRHIDLLLRKGVYPYEYVTNIEKFKETQLPPREMFYNKLTEVLISEEDYAHAHNVWKAFDMKTLGDYHDMYLMTDVLLLADVFESFRDMSMQYYKIDPCHMYSAPGLAWNAMLKMTGVELELLSDINHHIFVESAIRGGVSVIPTRYAKANNPIIPDQYDASTPTSYILYIDCNNLYGTAMSQPLPYAGFRWLERDEIDSLNVSSLEDASDIGYILEVDIEYPEELHELHNEYPLAPIRGKVTSDMLSPFSRRLRRRLYKRAGKTVRQNETSVEKLLTTLNDKEKYIVHYRNLKLYLSLGLRLKTIHRVLCFKQATWLKPFIDFNTTKRRAAANNFEKNFFKLMNNAVYGKSLENVRKRIDFKLISDERRLLKYVSTPRLKRIISYTDGLTGICLRKKCVTLSRPIYIGFSVLDISKLIMYSFHYNYSVAKYGTRLRLLMTDTDSLMYKLETEDVYKDMKANLDLFDTSEYPKNHLCYDITNKKALGKFKDETNGAPIREFVGLRAKCYSFMKFDKEEKNVAKGVPKTAITKGLRHNLYRDCLFRHCTAYTSATCIRSVAHKIYSQRQSKLSLSPYDDKRYILNDGVNTLAFGHYSIKSHVNNDNVFAEDESLENEIDCEQQMKRIKLDHDYCI